LLEDGRAVFELKALASGASGLLGEQVRGAAADLLVSAGADWQKLRFLAIAANATADDDDAKKALERRRGECGRGCPAAGLTNDLARVIMRWYFLLGCSD